MENALKNIKFTKSKYSYIRLVLISFVVLFFTTLITLIVLLRLGANKKSVTLFEIKYHDRNIKK